MASHGEKDKSKNTMCFLFSLYTKEQKGADLSYLSVCMSVCLYVCMSVCLYVCMSVCLYVCQIMALYVFAVNLFLKIRSIKRHFLSNFFQLCNFIINTPVCAIPFRHYFDPLGIFSLLRCKVFPFISRRNHKDENSTQKLKKPFDKSSRI